MHFHALTAFLAFSSASGLVVPSQGSRAASTITWTPAGVESTTAVYPGALATAPDLSVPNADQRVLDEDAVLRRAGLVVARSGVPTARRRRSSPGA